MADKKEDKVDKTTEVEVVKKSKKKLIIAVIIALLLILGIGGFLLYKKSHPGEPVDGEEDTTEVSTKETKKVYFFETLDKFTCNLNAVDGEGNHLDRFIQVQFVLQLEDNDSRSEKTKIIKDYNPFIKHTLLMTLTTYDDKTLLSLKGKKTLTEDIKTQLNKFFMKEIKEGKYKIKDKAVIDEILITDFIIQ